MKICVILWSIKRCYTNTDNDMIGGKVDDKVIAKVVQTLNKHLPVERKTLSALLSEDKHSMLSFTNFLRKKI